MEGTYDVQKQGCLSNDRRLVEIVEQIFDWNEEFGKQIADGES
jgi:hypothetical protein